MKVVNYVQIDFNKENDLKVPSVQYDSGSRFVKIKLQQNKVPFEINGYRVTVVANKVDGTEIMNDCTILDGANGLVEFEITEQFNAVEGVVDCQLKLFKGKTLLTSMPFSINVVKSVSTKEIVSSNELKTLVNALGEVQNIDNRFAQTNAQLSNKADKKETDNIQQQVNNLVLGAVGDGNNAEVIQARGSYSVLNDRLISIEDLFNKLDVSNISLTIVNGYYISTGGNLVINANYNYSEPILLKNGETITVLANAKGTNVRTIGLCMADGTGINDGVVGIGDVETWYEYTATNDCYVRACSFKTTKMVSYKIIKKADNYKFEKVSKSVDTLINSVELLGVDDVNVDFTTGGYVSTGGRIITDGASSFMYSALIPIKKGQTIRALLNSGSSSNPISVISKWESESSETGTSVIDASTDELKWYEYEANEDTFVRLCTLKSVVPTVIVYVKNVSNNDFNEKIEYLKNEIDNKTDIYKAVFNNVICIGDSLSAGSRGSGANPYTVPEISYPVQLGKITGWNVTKDAHPGISASGYWNTYGNVKDYSEFDTVIVFLGTNKGLTDTLEEDVVGDNYTDYANTNTGCYCKLIEKIKSDNQKVNIFLCTLFAKQYSSSTNPVIQKIANKYDLKVIDCNLEKYYSSSYEYYNVFHPFDSVHMDRIGYLDLANHIKESMCEIVSKNLADYNLK